MYTNTPSEVESSSSSKEVDRCSHVIVEQINPITNIMRELIQQQEKIIELMQQIAPKEKGSDQDKSKKDKEKKDAEELPEETRVRRLKLYRAALGGDWEVAKLIYDNSEENIGVEISKKGDTALHIAAAAKQIDFVKEVVKRMNDDDLEKPNKIGNTALFFAAASGKVELAREMMKNNKSIAMIPDKNGTLPIEMAAWLGNKRMVKHLYQETRLFLTEEHRKRLFISCIETNLYGFALQLLNDYQDLATAKDENGETALHVLARKHPSLSNFADQNQKGMFQRFFNLGNKVENKMQELQLVECIWRRVVRLSPSKISELISEPRKLIFDAAKRGNVKFLSILIGDYPDMIFKVDNKKNKYTIFHIAVKHRQEHVFKLIHEIGSIKEILLGWEDQDKNNILHLAGFLASQVDLNTVSGAALQMQRELLWFEKVKKVVQPRLAEARNKEGFTPRELFTEKHEGLREKGEQWMKDTATACSVVAALIATVAFAAAFTIPGGNNGDTGFPIFLDKVSLKIFAISDAISLVSSCASIVDFLSILCSRYAEEDFLKMLPRKLCIGLIALFLSIAAMMIVFSTTFFIFFNNKRLWMAIVAAAITLIPIIMFIRQHFRLFYDVLLSTCASDSFLRKGKKRLFREKEKESYHRRMNKILNPRLKTQCPFSTNV